MGNGYCVLENYKHIPMTNLQVFSISKSSKSVGPVRRRKLFDQPSKCQCLKNDSSLQSWNLSFIKYCEKIRKMFFLVFREKLRDTVVSVLEVLLHHPHQVEVSGRLHTLTTLPPGKPPVSVGQEAGLDTLGKRKISLPCRESNMDSSVIQPITWSLQGLRYPTFFSS